jgi:hypothetical protein
MSWVARLSATRADGNAVVDDLASLTKLDNDILVDQLRRRYADSKIYVRGPWAVVCLFCEDSPRSRRQTYIGDILVAVNPFRTIDLYNADESKKYRGCLRTALPPHIFAISDTAYRQMLDTRKGQCVLVSGESGAGKVRARGRGGGSAGPGLMRRGRADRMRQASHPADHVHVCGGRRARQPRRREEGARRQPAARGLWQRADGQERQLEPLRQVHGARL